MRARWCLLPGEDPFPIHVQGPEGLLGSLLLKKRRQTRVQGPQRLQAQNLPSQIHQDVEAVL